MKIVKFVIVAVLALGISAKESWAADVYAFGSYWELKDGDGSWGGGLGLALPIFGEHLKLDGRAYFFEGSDVSNTSSVDLIPLDIGAQFLLNPQGELGVYALGGLTYIYADGNNIDVDSDFGGYLGMGAQYEVMPGFPLFTELLYRFAELDTDSRNIDKFDVSGWSVNFGMKVTF